MNPTQPPPERDLEFRAPRSPSIWDQSDRLEVEHYQRLVANPFLGILGVLAWFLATRYVLSHATQVLAIPGLVLLLGSLFVLPRLFQYHCRDCGASGPLTRWRDHCCPIVEERWRLNRPRSWRGPLPFVQVVLWFYVLLALGVVVNALGWSIF